MNVLVPVVYHITIKHKSQPFFCKFMFFNVTLNFSKQKLYYS